VDYLVLFGGRHLCSDGLGQASGRVAQHEGDASMAGTEVAHFTYFREEAGRRLDQLA
jgi:hypothetical protein